MRRILLIALLALPLTLSAQSVVSRSGLTMKWSRTEMDGSRTGEGSPSRRGSAPKVAKAILDAQPEMAEVKQPVGHSENGMWARGANSPLANFACDALLDASEALFGRRADLSIINSGGIRGSVPAGEVLRDDIVAIFPFRNYLALVEWPGTVLLDYINRMVQRRYAQPYGGLKLVMENGELVSATVGGKEIDPNGTYYLVTIDFLLGTGDNMRLADGATNIQRSQTLIFDAIMDQINRRTAAGVSLDAAADDRFVYNK